MLLWSLLAGAIAGLVGYGGIFLLAGPASLLNVHTLPPGEVKKTARKVSAVCAVLAFLAAWRLTGG